MYRPGGIANDFDRRFQPHPGDLEIVKARYSAFINTTLAVQLRERGIQTVIALGLITDICISSTIRDAFHNEFDTVTLSDCTATSTLARHEAALAALADCFGTVCPSDAVVRHGPRPGQSQTDHPGPVVLIRELTKSIQTGRMQVGHPASSRRLHTSRRATESVDAS